MNGSFFSLGGHLEIMLITSRSQFSHVLWLHYALVNFRTCLYNATLFAMLLQRLFLLHLGISIHLPRMGAEQKEKTSLVQHLYDIGVEETLRIPPDTTGPTRNQACHGGDH